MLRCGYAAALVILGGCHIILPLGGSSPTARESGTSDAPDAGAPADLDADAGAPADLDADALLPRPDTRPPCPGSASTTAPVCSPDGWCWLNPLPQGNTLHGVWVDTSGLIVAVGDAATRLRFNTPPSWTGELSRKLPRLTAVWGHGPNDIWAVSSEGRWMHYDTTWKEGKLSVNISLHGVWGSGPSDVWIVGLDSQDGYIARWGGTANQWVPEMIPSVPGLRAIFGFSSSNVFAVGDVGTVLHFDGTGWTKEAPPSSALTESLLGVWGASANEVWAVSDKGSIYGRSASGTWALVAKQTGPLNAVWGTGPNDIWAVGPPDKAFHYDGSSWTSAPTGTKRQLYSVWGSASSNVWAVGDHGLMVHYNGTSWSLKSSPDDNVAHLGDVFGSDPCHVTAVGAQILEYDGQTATHIQSIQQPQLLKGGWRLAHDQAYAAGATDDLRRQDSTGWNQLASGTGTHFTDVWYAKPDEIWLVGDYLDSVNPADNTGRVVRYDGQGFYSQDINPTGKYVKSIHGLPTGHAFIVGYDFTMHRDPINKMWVEDLPSPPANLLAVWAASSNEAHAVGASCVHYLFNGTGWVKAATNPCNATTVGTSTVLRGIFGNTTAIVATGDQTLRLDRLSTAWTYQDTGSYHKFGGVWSGADDANQHHWFLAGDHGTLLHRKGN